MGGCWEVEAENEMVLGELIKEIKYVLNHKNWVWALFVYTQCNNPLSRAL